MRAVTNASHSPTLCWLGMGVQIVLNDDGSLGLKIVLANGQRLHTADHSPMTPILKDKGGESYLLLALDDAKPPRAVSAHGSASRSGTAPRPRATTQRQPDTGARRSSATRRGKP